MSNITQKNTISSVTTQTINGAAKQTVLKSDSVSTSSTGVGVRKDGTRPPRKEGRSKKKEVKPVSEAIPYGREGRIQHKVKEYEATMRYYLAHSATIGSYKQELLRMIEQNRDTMIPNLHAIVMPGGHGKTHLCTQYGFMDVDDLVGGEDFCALGDIRYRLVESNTMEWTEHNQKWYKCIRSTLLSMTFDLPTVVMVHSEECAISIGATIMGVIALEDSAFEANIRVRKRVGQAFSRISRQFVLHRSMNTVNMCRSNQEVEAAVLALCNILEVPVACPYKYTKRVPNKWYGLGVPEWLLVGDVENREGQAEDVLSLALRKLIPKACADHFFNANCPTGVSHGYGVTMWEWAKIMGRIMGSIPKRKLFHHEGDMFDIFPPDSQAERHRVNITLRRLITECKILENSDTRTIMEYHVGEKHVFVSGLICHWLGLGSQVAIADYIYPLYLVPLNRWTELLGEFHNLIRLSGWFCTTELSTEDKQALMYMNMYTGRQIYEADWEKVVEERRVSKDDDFVSYDLRIGRWTRAQYLVDFDVALEMGYSRMFSQPKAVNVDNFVQFWKRRRSWVAKGSTVLNQIPKEMLSYVLEFGDHMSQKIKMRHNKKSLFENHEIIGLLTDTPETWNMTKCVPKLNETGKKRELLPGTLMHYLVFSYVLYIAEQQQRIGSTRLNVNDDDNLAYYDNKMIAGLHHMLYDWANFNAQHSVDDMAKVIAMLEKIPGVPEDYGYFCHAIAESFYHMWVIDPKGGKHKIEKGLFSGWRGTTWINTVLNFVYVSVGVMCCERIYSDFKPAYFDHGGDDLDVAFYKPQDCYRMMSVMDRIGYEATRIKQMVGYDAEFYRNTINARGVFSSPSRALANFVSGNWESGGAKTLTEKTASILDQVAKLERRGVEPGFCNSLIKMALSHWLKVKIEDDWFVIKPEVVHGKIEQGGLGVPDEYGEVWNLSKDITRPGDRALDAYLPGVYCSSDYVDVVENDLNAIHLQLGGKSNLIKKLAKQSYDLEQFQERAVFADMNKIDTQKVSGEKVIVPMWDPNLFEEFLAWMSCGGAELHLEKIDMLKEFVGHIFLGDRELRLADLIAIFVNARVSEDVVSFKSNHYYRRLVPDFMASVIDKFTRYHGNLLDVEVEEMDKVFNTICYMVHDIYEHKA